MNFARRVQEVALRLVELLEESSTPYAIMGGIAIPVWGIPRATYDIDVVLSVGEPALSAFVARAKQSGFGVDPAFERGFRDALAGMEKIRLEWWTEETRCVDIDVFLVTTAYQKAAFERRCRAKINDHDAWVLSAADLILHKLLAGRPKDLADVMNLLSVQGLPDAAYVREWAGRLGVEAALASAVAAADLPPG